MNLDPFNLAYLAGYVVFVCIRGAYDSPKQLRKVVLARRDALEVVGMAAVGVGIMLAPLIYLFTPLFNFFSFEPMVLVRSVGVAVMTISLVLFWRAHADLGGSFSRTLEIREGHRLVTHGVYRLVRHPMYAAIWLFALAQALTLPNWTAALAGLASFAFMYFPRVPREETLMLEEFGQEYQCYMQRTPRLLPFDPRRPGGKG